jgi:hypothetical protein
LAWVFLRGELAAGWRPRALLVVGDFSKLLAMSSEVRFGVSRLFPRNGLEACKPFPLVGLHSFSPGSSLPPHSRNHGTEGTDTRLSASMGDEIMKLLTAAIALVSVGILSGCVEDGGYRTGGYYSSGVSYRSYDRDRYYGDRYRRDYDRRDWRDRRESRDRRQDRREWRGEQPRQPESQGGNRVIRPHILYRNAD